RVGHAVGISDALKHFSDRRPPYGRKEVLEIQPDDNGAPLMETGVRDDRSAAHERVRRVVHAAAVEDTPEDPVLRLPQRLARRKQTPLPTILLWNAQLAIKT